MPTTTRRHTASVPGLPDLTQLRRALCGELVLREDPVYDQARQVWNGMVDKAPAAIAYCTRARDVIEAITFARSTSLPLSVRGCGHNVAGNSVCDDGLVIDLSRMKSVTVDPARAIARAQAGLSLGELDAATQAHGLATTMGINGDTGVAGLTLGGGFGKLARKHGLACDNLVGAEVVTADGRLLHASAEENPDLYWGLRGGGGNFGIVTELEFRLHELGPEILRASLTYDWKHARDALRLYDEFAIGAPDEASADAALASGPTGDPIFAVSICYIGPVQESAPVFERLLRPWTSQLTPIQAEIGPVPYLDIQSAADSIFPRGRRYYWKAQFLKRIDDGAIDALVEHFPAVPSPRSLFVFQHVGGAVSRVAPGATAYVNRDAIYDSFPLSIWDSADADEANIAWARELWRALKPFSTGGVYVNNLGEEGPDRVRAAYGGNHDRLVALKTAYDPTNLFRMNQNIRPAP